VRLSMLILGVCALASVFGATAQSQDVPQFAVVEDAAQIQAEPVALRNPTLKSDTFWSPIYGAVSARTLTGKPASGIALASELAIRDMRGVIVFRAQLVQTAGPRGTIEAVPIVQNGVVAFRYTTSYPDSTSVDRVLEDVALTSFGALSEHPDQNATFPLVLR